MGKLDSSTQKNLRVLTFTTLYPSDAQPRHGIFIEQRLRQISNSEVTVRVVAPVPWFPLKSSRFGHYASFARTSRQEQRYGIEVTHPRYPVIPKVGMTLAPFLLAISVLPHIRKIRDDGYDFDVIDAHYFYPDGVAAVMLGGILGKPVVITARGSDLNIIPRYRLPRLMIQWAAKRAVGLVTVCQALKDVLVGLGIDDSGVRVLRNGVDLQLFSPCEDRMSLRQSFAMHDNVLLSVGNLVPLKGHDLLIQALMNIKDSYLIIVGDGPERSNLEQLAVTLDVSERVRFIPIVSQQKLKQYYAAADILVLASSSEGWANVLLESMACGTPVVATAVGGSPEIIDNEKAGVLVTDRSADGLAKGIRKLLNHYPDRNVVRKYAEQFSWDETSRGQIEVFHHATVSGAR